MQHAFDKSVKCMLSVSQSIVLPSPRPRRFAVMGVAGCTSNASKDISVCVCVCQYLYDYCRCRSVVQCTNRGA